MKALLILASSFVVQVSGLTAATTCKIPDQYAITAAANTCGGPRPGYLINSYCVSALTGTAAAAANPVIVPLIAANVGQFSDVVAPPVVTGCVVAAFAIANTAGFVTAGTCPAGMSPFTVALESKGVNIACDTANLYYPSAGMGGSLQCQGVAAPWTNSLLTTGTFIIPTGVPGPAQFTPSMHPTWAAGTFRCNMGCTLPASMCMSGMFNPGLIMTGQSFDNYGNAIITSGTNCIMRPTTTATFQCRVFGNTATYTASCLGIDGMPGQLSWTGAAGTPMCFVPFGAVTSSIIGDQDPSGTMPEKSLEMFPTVTSTLTSWAGTRTQFGGVHDRIAESTFQSGNGRILTITGCNVATNANLCVQDAVNWWRCRGLSIDSASICTSNSVQIPCPTHALGWRCGTSSKKGLLGLLGLLGIIPCLALLLLCCFLLPCFARRKKTEGDVHFATFDPHVGQGGSVVAPSLTGPCMAPTMAPTMIPCGGVPTLY